jgi:hypothetical protein
MVGIATGFYTWWLNYLAKPIRAVKIKIPLTLTMLITEITLFIWRIRVPHVLDLVCGSDFVYLVLVFSLVPMITLIGWFGASMSFPIEK